MNEDFVLSSSEETRKLFRPPSRAMKCRQLIWATTKATGENPVALADLVRDHEEFRASEIYRAARALVLHGILTREDISWAELVGGRERTRYRYAVRHVEPFESASRHW
jgi:hypothetical protein